MIKQIKCKFTIITLSILAICSWAIARPHRICGDCMEPAITDGHLYFSNQLGPYLRKHRIDDIITFTHEDRLWISRIVALENDTIEIRENEIIINGIVLNNSISRNWNDWDYGTYAIKKSFKVPTNHVYVLSDNLAAHHDDSRVFGPINKSEINGLIW
jgi:signal peptidase I